MTREDLLRSKEYWVTSIQCDLFNVVEEYMKENGFNRTQLAEKFGVSKGYISQVLNMDFDHKISKLVDFSLSCNSIPILNFFDLDEYIKEDAKKIGKYDPY